MGGVGDRSKDTTEDRKPNESACLGSGKEKDSRSRVLNPLLSRVHPEALLCARQETELGFHGADLNPGLWEPGQQCQQSPGKWADAAK